jgi:hypothetical protein
MNPTVRRQIEYWNGCVAAQKRKYTKQKGIAEDTDEDFQNCIKASLEESKSLELCLQMSLQDAFKAPTTPPPKRLRRILAVPQNVKNWDESDVSYYECPKCKGAIAFNKKHISQACARYAHEQEAGGCGVNFCLGCGLQSNDPDEIYLHLHSSENDCVVTFCSGVGCLACDIKNCHGKTVPAEFIFLKRLA